MASWLNLSADDGHEFSAYYSESASTPSKGRVVVVQEVFGVNQHIRDVCERFSKSGYDALAPSLFDRLEPGVQLGYSTEDVDKGRDLRSRLDWNDALNDTLASISYLAQWPRGRCRFLLRGSHRLAGSQHIPCPDGSLLLRFLHPPVQGSAPSMSGSTPLRGT